MIPSSRTYNQCVRSVLAQQLPWDRLSGSKVLLTGATGMLGGFIADVLMASGSEGMELYVTGRNKANAESRLSCYWNDKRFHFIQADLELPLECDVRFNYVIHCAGNAYPKALSEDPVGTLRGTVLGTANLLEYCRVHGVDRFLYVSSAEVYGQGDGNAWKEHDSGSVDPLVPRSCYPVAKRSAENMCVAYASQFGIDVSIVRPSHIFGPNFTDSDNHAYVQFLKCALEKRDIVLKSNGVQQRGYCFVADCAYAVLMVLFKGENAMAYNISDENGFMSIRGLAGQIASLAGTEVVFENPEDSDLKGFSPLEWNRLDNTLLKSLGWSPLFSVEQGLRNTYEILKER